MPFQGHKEWLAEVHFLGVVEHRNLVKLIGYCASETERGPQRLLVYEFMPNKTLDDHLFIRRGVAVSPRGPGTSGTNNFLRPRC
jgi:hypothetical protein